MLPISILPAAGILLAFGDRLGIELMTNAGGILFDNLPLLFAVGAAVGLSGESGIAALAAIVSMLILNSTAGIVAHVTPEMAEQGGAYTFIMGIPTLQSGVFGGLVAGVIAATMYNKFYQIKLPDFLGFFSGKRFVPIITAILSFLVGLVFPMVWEPIQSGIAALSNLAMVETKQSQLLYLVLQKEHLFQQDYITFSILHIGLILVIISLTLEMLSMETKQSGLKCLKRE